MRIISTGEVKKIAIIAAEKRELIRLQRLQLLNQFNDYITTQPEKSEQYQCFIVVYTFDDGSKARLFRLAYALARRNGKLARVKRAQTSKLTFPSYKAARKAATRKRRPAHRPKQGTVTNVLSVTLGIDHGHCSQTMATTKVRCRAELGSWVRNGIMRQ
jgi:hypothetical protein